jgi:hypothetical protein
MTAMPSITLLEALLELEADGCTHVVDEYESDHEVMAIGTAIDTARQHRPDQLGGMPIWVRRGRDIFDDVELEMEHELINGMVGPPLAYRHGVTIRTTAWERLLEDDGDEDGLYTRAPGKHPESTLTGGGRR